MLNGKLRLIIAVFICANFVWNSLVALFKDWKIRANSPKMFALMIAPMNIPIDATIVK